MAERSSIDIYIDAEFKERLRAAGINCSRVARDAWRVALAEAESSNTELVAALGPVVHTASPIDGRRRGTSRVGSRRSSKQ